MTTRFIEIEEEKGHQKGYHNLEELMTPEQIRRGEYYSHEYHIRRGEVDTAYKNLWDELQKLYQCKRNRVADDEDYPCSFVPLLTPTVEGQVASMMETDMDFRHVTNNPGHQSYMPQLDAASEYYRRKSKFKPHFKDFARYYDLLGNCWVTISWDKGYSKKGPGGCPKITVPPLLSVLVDGRIKDSKDLQSADYIIHEIGYQSIAWARKEFGDKYADMILSGFNRQEDDEVSESYDDSETFMLLNVWTRSNEEGNLQLIQMDANGLILSESDSSKPYYENVDNEYPFGIARMIPQLGQFYGIGDGVILKPMQETVNNLTDELELAARFNAQARMFVDPKAKMAPDQITSDPSEFALCTDPNNNIKIAPPAGVSPIVFNMIEFLLREAQKAVRFHESMTGNQQGTSATATQINTQLTQGYTGIKDKKSDLADVMGWADMYALRLCIEKWDKGFWASLGEGHSEWIDPESLGQVPQSIPTTTASINKSVDSVRKGIGQGDIDSGSELNYYETAMDGDKEIMADIEFSTRVVIGEAMPKGRTDMYNILLGLGQMQVMNKDGQPEPLISADRLREAMEDVLGMKLKTQAEEHGEVLKKVEQMMSDVNRQLNPIGNENAVQAPTATPPNLQQTVPQTPNGDSRRIQM